MEGYCGGRVDGIVVPNDQEAWSRFQSVARWKQWGVNAEDNFGSVDNGAADEDDFSCVTLMDEYEMDCQEDEPEISGVQGGISESSNCWTTFGNSQDMQQHGYPRTIQTDENFVNSMLLDDARVGKQFQVTCSTADKMHATERSYENFKALEPLNALDLEKHSDASHESLSHSIENDVTQYNAPLGNLETFVSVEETVLQDFGKAMCKMTDNTRLCFRDALYRLASDSGKHSSIQGQHEDECVSENPFKASLLGHSSRSVDKHISECRTKAIDVTIADLMFNKAYEQYDDCHKGIGSTHKPQSIYSSEQPLTTQFRCNALISSDSEVPMLG